MTGLLTLTIFCVGPEGRAGAGFCTSVTVWVLPVLVVTTEMVGFMPPPPSFIPPPPLPPRLMRLPVPKGVGKLDIFCCCV